MRMFTPALSHLRRTAPAGLLLVAAACGSSNTGPSGGNASFSATLDGAAWNAAAAATAAQGNANGTYTIVGSDLKSPATALSLTLYNISAPGTYPIGVGSSVTGGTAIVTVGASASLTPLSGAAGTVTLTAVSATHITGTFAYTAGAHAVTQGSFDLAVTSSGSVAVAANAGGHFGGMLGGAAWNAATVVMVAPPSSGTLTIGASNDAYTLNIIVSGFTGSGPYTLNTGVARQATLIKTGTTQNWGGPGAQSTGTITVTSSTASRVAGNYDITLLPNAGGAAGNVQLTGTFDVGIP